MRMRKAPSLFVTEMLESKDGFCFFFVGAGFHRFGNDRDWWFWELCWSEGEEVFFDVDSRYPVMIDLLELLYGIPP